MDTITFEIGDTTILLVNGEALFWTNGRDHDPDVVIEISLLRSAQLAATLLKSK